MYFVRNFPLNLDILEEGWKEMKLVTQLRELHTELDLVVDFLCFVDEKGKGRECDTSFKKIRALSKNTFLRELTVFLVKFLLNFEENFHKCLCQFVWNCIRIEATF